MRAVFVVVLLLACRPTTTGGGKTTETASGDSHTGIVEAGETAAESGAESGLESGFETGDPIEVVPGHAPGEALFTDDEVHALSLALDDDAWASLLAAPTTYAEARFSDGESELLVGVRLKGYSSYQPLTGKPNIRVSFDRYVEGQTYDGLEAVDLINEAEDPAAMSEALAYRIFRQAGQPASRTGFGWVTINDLDYGLYTLVEKKDDVLIDRWWPDDDEGSLYESSSEVWPCDLDDGGTPRCDCWDHDEVGSADSRADLEALCAVATDTPDADWYAAIAETVDWTEVSRHMAMEMVLDAHDHYAGYMGNVYLYHSPEAEAWSLLPASMNSLYGSSRYVPGSCGSSGRSLEDFDGGLLIRRCWDNEACAADQLEAVRWAAEALAASDALTQIDTWEALLAPYVEADPKLGYSLDAFHLQVSCIRDWLAGRPAELAPLLPAECLGEDGELDVSGWGDLSTNGSCDRSWPDAVGYGVSAISGARVDLGAAPDGIEAGDALIAVVMQGGAGDHSLVGSYAFGEVVSVDATGLTLSSALDLGISGAVGEWKVLVQRVPSYDNVVIRAGGLLSGGAYNGETGGVLAMRVSGTLTIEEGGSLSAVGIGYAGGPMGESYNSDGYQGESLEGSGIGGASSTEGYNETNGAWAANLGGGGCNIGGGGGEHAGGATGSTSWNGTATAPEAGETYGDLSALFLGSGGGGVVNLGGGSGPGGAGGGILFVEAAYIVAEGAEAISAAGEDATSWAAGSWTYGAGGGAGGTLWITAEALELADGAIVATGGAGYDGVTRPGGDGGVGRIAVSCGTVNGEACEDADWDGLTEPAAVVDGL